MDATQHSKLVSNIADDVLRDPYVRGKYRDVILPMTVLRRPDVILEPRRQAVLDMKASLNKAKTTNEDHALRQAPAIVSPKGYEVSSTRYFYKPQPLRSLEEIRADILALEKETEGLLAEIVGGGVS